METLSLVELEGVKMYQYNLMYANDSLCLICLQGSKSSLSSCLSFIPSCSCYLIS